MTDLPGGDVAQHGVASGQWPVLHWSSLRFVIERSDMRSPPVVMLETLRRLIGHRLKRYGCLAEPHCGAERDEKMPCRHPRSCPYAILFEGGPASVASASSHVDSARTARPPLIFSLDSPCQGSPASLLTATIVGWPRVHHPLVALAVMDVAAALPGAPQYSGTPLFRVSDWQMVPGSERRFDTPASDTATIRIETPLVLRPRPEIRGQFDVSVFFRRLLERLDDLSERYGFDDGQPGPVDRFRLMRAQIDNVQLVSWKGGLCEETSRGRSQKSNRLFLDGLTGVATIAGLTPGLWRALLLGELLHAGAKVTEGCGQYRIEKPTRPPSSSGAGRHT